ncbi:MAG: serine/threonine protein [Planctomycetota bacterium]|nr:MAG: serine/threonine protein [Planctomycetota bacterium]
MRRKPVFAGAVALGLALLLFWGCAQDPQPAADSKGASTEPLKVELDLDKAVAIELPKTPEALKPACFSASDGREGWVVQIPGNRPLATPAYADGMLFVGGGYGSFEFYAFDAKTGALVWQIKTGDDGPTGAVVEDGCVAFNTESCTVIVAEAKTGKILWQEWLGDPLMSQPAIWKGRLYMAYPAGGRGGMQTNEAGPAKDPVAVDPKYPHRLLCAELKTGKHLWERPITGDILSAPIIADGKAVFTCFDGTSFCVSADDGAVVWEKANAGTSAPVVARGQIVLTQKEVKDGKTSEGMARLDAKGVQKDEKLLARSDAKYLGKDAGGGVALQKDHLQALDSSVGFGQAPATAGLGAANDHVGVNSVAGGWAFQGSRAGYNDGQFMNAQGRGLNCMGESGRMAWRAECRGIGVTDETQVFSPPSLGRVNMYLCSGMGHLAEIAQKDGKVGFLYSTKAPMASQPALAEGNLYVGTADGRLVCLKAGPDADGWTAWGGNAQHNKGE